MYAKLYLHFYDYQHADTQASIKITDSFDIMISILLDVWVSVSVRTYVHHTCTMFTGLGLHQFIVYVLENVIACIITYLCICSRIAAPYSSIYTAHKCRYVWFVYFFHTCCCCCCFWFSVCSTCLLPVKCTKYSCCVIFRLFRQLNVSEKTTTAAAAVPLPMLSSMTASFWLLLLLHWTRIIVFEQEVKKKKIIKKDVKRPAGRFYFTSFFFCG